MGSMLVQYGMGESNQLEMMRNFPSSLVPCDILVQYWFYKVWESRTNLNWWETPPLALFPLLYTGSTLVQLGLRESNQLELMRIFPNPYSLLYTGSIQVQQGMEESNQLFNQYITEELWQWGSFMSVQGGSILPNLSSQNLYFTDRTRLVGKFLIISSLFDFSVPYRTNIEPVYHRRNKASREESHQFKLVWLSQTS